MNGNHQQDHDNTCRKIYTNQLVEHESAAELHTPKITAFAKRMGLSASSID